MIYKNFKDIKIACRDQSDFCKLDTTCEYFYYFCRPQRDISSVGLEHRLDRAGVTGSNPVYPTKKSRFTAAFCISPS